MNQNNDKVSVVIPIFNNAEFLRESINSILDQTHKNIEIIAVNDGSTDNSLELLEEYSDRIHIISQTNQGLSVALNTGVKNATGKWFKWFSPDDVLYPNAIETLVNVANSLPTNTIIYSNWDLVDEKGKKLRSFFEKNYNELSSFEFNIRLLDNQQVNVNTALIPVFLVNKYKFQNLKDPVAIDYDFFLTVGIMEKTKFYLIEKNLIKYRINKNQLSHRNILRTISYLNVIRNEILSKLKNEEKNKYLLTLSKYQKSKPLKSKILVSGLILLKILPGSLADFLLRFYLNNIRTHR